jgi:hypothetical protein
MNVTIDEIAGISRNVALEHGRGLHVAAITVAAGAIDRVEVILTVAGCHEGDCRFVVNVTRADLAAFEREFRVKLRDALGKHVPA